MQPNLLLALALPDEALGFGWSLFRFYFLESSISSNFSGCDVIVFLWVFEKFQNVIIFHLLLGQR